MSKMLLSRTLRNSARDLGHPRVLKLFPGDRGAKKMARNQGDWVNRGPGGNPNVQIPLF